MANTLTVDLPFGLEAEEARLLFSIKLFEEGKISLGLAAKMAGYTKRTYIELLGKRGVPVFRYAPDDLAQELETLNTFRAQSTREAPDRPRYIDVRPATRVASGTDRGRL